MSARIYASAQEYARLGWKIFPLHAVVDGLCTCGNLSCTDQGKHPRVQGGVKRATDDLDQIELWFGPGSPPSNIAIATGEISDLTVFDIDISDGKVGAQTWAAAIKGHGEPETLMSATGSGGMHVLFRYNSALRTAGNVLGKGVDVRNDGGYIVAPPSNHISGGAYSWIDWGAKIGVVPSYLSRQRAKLRKKRPKGPRYNIQQVKTMLDVVPADDRDLWRHVGIILGREFERSGEAWELYQDWAAKGQSKKGRNHDQIMHESFYVVSQQQSDASLSVGTIVKEAKDNGWAPKSGMASIDMFIYYAPTNKYIYRSTSDQWPATSVDGLVSPVNQDGELVKPSDWLKQHRPATSMTIDPLYDDDYIKGFDSRNGEAIPVEGAAMYNAYRRPRIEPGDADLATPFLDHVHKIFDKPGDADQFLDYMAHRVQKPGVKPRFSLLIAGGQGVGKDTAIEMCVPAIGSWNVANIDPNAIDSAFNEFAAATLVRISEAANLQEMSKWAFNERVKVLIAGNPDIVEINPKYGEKFSVRMHCGVVLTTNHLGSGIYIPEDDRRYDVIDCATMSQMGLSDPKAKEEYFSRLWGWYNEGGASHIASFLHERDISKFNAATGQRKTEAYKSVIAEGFSGDSWLLDILDALDNPKAVRSDVLLTVAEANGQDTRKLLRRIAPTLSRHGYKVHRNAGTKDGRWRLGTKYVTVYTQDGVPRSYDPTKDTTGLMDEKF